MTSIRLRLLGFHPQGMIFQRPGEQIFGGVVYLVMCMCLATATKVLTVEMAKQLTYLSVSLVGHEWFRRIEAADEIYRHLDRSQKIKHHSQNGKLITKVSMGQTYKDLGLRNHKACSKI